MEISLPVGQTRDFGYSYRNGVSREPKQRSSMSLAGTNLLLKALKVEDREYLLDRSEEIVLPRRTVLYHPDETPQYGYFLTSGIASIVAIMEDGEAAEVGMIGAEGLVGGFELLGPALVSTQCIIQGAGEAVRIPFADLRDAFEERRYLRSRILEFVQEQALMHAQLAGCHRLHEAEERLARWLLMAQDRTESDVLNLTQEFLAEMLGSRRTTITVVAGSLQRHGLIEYSRGRVKILDREGLASVACSCYPIVRALYANLYARGSSQA
jgi:CRP-like cAMP-binding protein